MMTVEMVVAGTLETFDAASFTANLAAMLPAGGVNASDITLNVTAASLLVKASMPFSDPARAQTSMDRLQAMSPQNWTVSLGMTVESAHTSLSVVVAAAAPVALGNTAHDGAYSGGIVTTLFITVGVILALWISCMIGLACRARSKQRAVIVPEATYGVRRRVEAPHDDHEKNVGETDADVDAMAAWRVPSNRDASVSVIAATGQHTVEESAGGERASTEAAILSSYWSQRSLVAMQEEAAAMRAEADIKARVEREASTKAKAEAAAEKAVAVTVAAAMAAVTTRAKIEAEVRQAAESREAERRAAEAKALAEAEAKLRQRVAQAEVEAEAEARAAHEARMQEEAEAFKAAARRRLVRKAEAALKAKVNSPEPPTVAASAVVEVEASQADADPQGHGAPPADLYEAPEADGPPQTDGDPEQPTVQEDSPEGAASEEERRAEEVEALGGHEDSALDVEEFDGDHEGVVVGQEEVVGDVDRGDVDGRTQHIAKVGLRPLMGNAVAEAKAKATATVAAAMEEEERQLELERDDAKAARERDERSDDNRSPRSAPRSHEPQRGRASPGSTVSSRIRLTESMQDRLEKIKTRRTASSMLTPNRQAQRAASPTLAESPRSPPTSRVKPDAGLGGVELGITLSRDARNGSLGIDLDEVDGKPLVARVLPGGPAERDGVIMTGDIIAEIDGIACGSIADAVAVLSSEAIGSKSPLGMKVIRRARRDEFE